MPLVDGNQYAELRDTGQQSRTLRLLVLGSPIKELGRYFISSEVLRNYLEEIGSAVNIQLYSSDSKLKLHDSTAVDVATDLTNYKQVRDFGLANDIDIILDLQSLLVCDETKAYNVEFGYVDTVDELYMQCEAFLAGNGIAWNMRDPVWNDNWVRIFFSRAGLSKTAMDFMNLANLKGKYTSEQIERTRHFANRLSQIEYGRLMLKYWLVMKRKERRRTQKHLTVSFEIHYHLGNYYFLIGGAFDMLARLLNSVFGLGFKQYKHLAVEKPIFYEALGKHNKELAKVYSDQQNIDWLLWLKTRRNYISHDASISITSIVKEPKTKITDEAINKLVDEKLNWQFLADVLPPHLLESQRRMVAELVRVDLYDVEFEDAMLLRDKKSDKIFLPLNSVDYDFEQMSKMIEPTIKILTDLQEN